MNGYALTFAGCDLVALPSGALYWPAAQLLCVSDLHLGKAGRQARLGGALLPPYEVRETLGRLDSDLARTAAKTVICLGDSFDIAEGADELDETERTWITRLQAGRRWVWIEGNHDPVPIGLGGQYASELRVAPLSFRHIAAPGAEAEVSGHYHPKVQLRTRARSITRPAFLVDETRIVMPAYGAFTGGLRATDAALQRLMSPDSLAVLTGPAPCAIPMPRL